MTEDEAYALYDRHLKMCESVACEAQGGLCSEGERLKVQWLAGGDETVLSYPEAWAAFWRRWLGVHSMLRCPAGLHCPGGCGATAKDELRRLVQQDRGVE